MGLEKRASVPAPSAAPDIDVLGPAKGRTKPLGVSIRTAWKASLKNTKSLALMATPEGEPTSALPAAPFEEPVAPDPAREVTTPPGVIKRSRWFPLSDTTYEPSRRTAANEGLKNWTAVPMPLP